MSGASGHPATGSAQAVGATGAPGSQPAGGGEHVQLPPTLERLGKKVIAGEIARLVGHEVNNHLQGIIGLADLLSEEAQDSAAKASLLQIKLQAERIAGLQRSLSRLLAQERRDEGLQPVDLALMWREVEELVHGAVSRRQVRLQVTMPANLPACLADPTGLSQVLMVAMLWHFRSLERRTGWTDVRPELVVLVRPVTTPKGPGIEWLSRDNGAGVPAVMNPAPSPEEHPELYDDLTTIGLIHLLQIVNQHGARLATQSDSQEGLELQITFQQA